MPHQPWALLPCAAGHPCPLFLGGRLGGLLRTTWSPQRWGQVLSCPGGTGAKASPAERRLQCSGTPCFPSQICSGQQSCENKAGLEQDKTSGSLIHPVLFGDFSPVRKLCEGSAYMRARNLPFRFKQRGSQEAGPQCSGGSWKEISALTLVHWEPTGCPGCHAFLCPSWAWPPVPLRRSTEQVRKCVDDGARMACRKAGQTHLELKFPRPTVGPLSNDTHPVPAAALLAPGC